MKQISQQSFEQSMKGIVSDTDAALRDEAPQAYKVNTEKDKAIAARGFALTLRIWHQSWRIKRRW